MSNEITTTEAVRQLYDTLSEKPIFGSSSLSIKKQCERTLERVGRWDSDVFYGKWERAWGCSCTLRAQLSPGTRRNKPIWLLECEVTWSSCEHSVASAMCAITLYREVVELAVLLESQWAQQPVIRVEEQP